MAHLRHPYPTEDEKQDLMRQTGLQMSEPPQTRIQSWLPYDLTLTREQTQIEDQISNWFINARRRQLPTMISNARAESSAISSSRRSGSGKSHSPVSDDGHVISFQAELERHRACHMKRGSI